MSYVGRDMSLHLKNNEQAALRDLHLVSAALAGSSDAFAELQRLYSRQLYSTIFAITKNREDAEDVLQDAFLRAYLALSNFEGRSSFCSWLTRIAINSALMMLRKHRDCPEVPFGPPCDAEDGFPQFEIKDSAPNPEQIYDQSQRCASMLRAIQNLKPNLRGAVQIRMAKGGSLKEIAQTLDISVAAVKTRLHRARVRLSPAHAFGNAEEKLRASSGPQPGLTPGLQNREQPCMNANQCL